MMQTVFFEMFLNVAHNSRSSFRKYSLCKLSMAVQDLNQHAILHNTSISNMKFIPHTHSCIQQSGLQKGFVTFSKRADIYKRKQMQKGKIQRKARIVRWRERERERGGREGGRKGGREGGWAETNRKLKRGGLRSDRQEPGGSNWQRWLQLEKCSTRAWWMRLRVATQLFHLETFQLAEVAEHSLRPKHLSSSLWWALPGKDQ